MAQNGSDLHHNWHFRPELWRSTRFLVRTALVSRGAGGVQAQLRCARG